MEKETIIASIIDVCKNMDLNYATKVKTAKWSADVVVEHKTYKAMHEERVCGCWLLLPSKNSSYQQPELPCFNIEFQTEKKLVYLNSRYNKSSNNLFDLSEFLYSLIDGKIRFAEQIEVNKAELCFYKNECWKCHTENDVYFVNRLFSQEGAVIDGQQLNITFNPSIITGLKNYIQEHPSEKFIMGEIKQRYSNTVKQAYPSFGCSQCDSIFGKFYLQEDIMELGYNTDHLRKVIITLDTPIKVPAHCWYKTNN